MQENETNARVSAIKKIPVKLSLLLLLSALFTHDDGKTNSNAPKNDNAKTTNNKKKKKLKTPFVESEFKASEPKITVINNPKTT